MPYNIHVGYFYCCLLYTSKVGDSTIIIVAQRINTVLDADQIVVMDEGHMAGIGTHEELMQSCEVYKEIALSQLSEEELERGRK